ncbi:MAG: biotin--[acetyl-CoA-carboxylase] ligase [Pseudomonadota bacterium]
MTSTLDATRLVAALGQASRRFDVDLLPQCDSTNSMLLSRAEVGAASGTVVAATLQTAGRGRRGREWIAAPGDSLTFSLLWRFAPGSVPIGLSLAVGVAVARALEKVGAGDTPQSFDFDRRKCRAVSGKSPWGAALKWPNDVLYQGKKLGGILVELLPGAPHVAVIGIGINRRLPAALPHDVRATAAALGDHIEINVLLAALLSELLTMLESFAIAGFAALRADWLARHAFQDAPVVLLSDFSPPRHGICRGVDKDGALLLEVDGHIERILSGEISLRAAAPV